MAIAVNFTGANFTFRGDEDQGGAITDLHVFRQPNGPANVSCWELSEEELAEINRTGRVYLSVMSGRIFFPAFVGSERTTRALVADLGQLWSREG